MPVSGLVLTLTDAAPAREQALATVRSHPAVDVGEPCGGRVPIVVDTLDSEADKEMWEWLGALPGVLFVDLVCTDSSADPPHDAALAGAAGEHGAS